MIAVLAGALLALQDRSIVQSELPNGAKYRIERNDNIGFVASLFLATNASQGEPNTPGLQHLVEHLAAKGPDRTLDRQLEARGLALVASTDRDGVSFTIVGPASEAPMALEAIKQLMVPLVVSHEEIEKELKIMAQERILESDYWPFVEAAWMSLIDPPVETIAGNLTALAEVTPDQVRQAQQDLFGGGGMSLFVAGQIDPETTSLRVEEILTAVPKGHSNRFELRNVQESIGRRGEAPGRGAARAVLSAGLDRPMTLARIGSALAMNQALGGISVMYEPSCDRGPIVMYSPRSGVFDDLRQFREEDVSRIAPVARLMAARWASGLIVPGPDYAVLKAKLIRQRPTFDLNSLRDTAVGLTDEEIWDALRDWQGSAMHIEGSR